MPSAMAAATPAAIDSDEVLIAEERSAIAGPIPVWAPASGSQITRYSKAQ
jgi:hypothetical protein